VRRRHDIASGISRGTSASRLKAEAGEPTVLVARLRVRYQRDMNQSVGSNSFLHSAFLSRLCLRRSFCQALFTGDAAFPRISLSRLLVGRRFSLGIDGQLYSE